MDSTLYENEAYARFQVDVQIDRLARERGESVPATMAALERARAAYAAKNGGRKASLGNAFEMLGVPISTSVAWRNELLDPSAFIGHDEATSAALAALARRHFLLCLTNNPVRIAEKTLAAIGAIDSIGAIVGLDSTLRSKPEPEPFLAAREAIIAAVGPVENREIVSVGDRYDVDLAVPLSMGMGAVLVEGIADILGLESLLTGENLYQ